MSRLRFRIVIAVALLLIVALGTAILRRDRVQAVPVSELTEPGAATPLPVSTVRAGDVAAPTFQPSFAGVLAARYESELGFERGGRVVEVLVEEGDFVQTGEKLAALDVSDLEATQQRTQAELAAAEALLQEFTKGPRQQTIDAAEAKVAALKANLRLAQSDLGRERQLTTQGAGSGRALDSAAFSEQSIRENLKAAESELDLLREGTRKEQIAAQQAVCDSIRGRLAEIEAMQQDSLIVAPFTGRIGARMVDPGVVLSSGDAVLRLLSDQLEARFGIPADIAAQLEIDQHVEVSVSGDQRPAKVRRLEPMVDRITRTRGVYVELADKSIANKNLWVAGQVARVHLSMPMLNRDIDETAAESFWIPTSALSRGGRGIWTLLVLPGDEQDAVAERRAVELLRSDGEHALVGGMLQRGERVVDAGRHRITAGILLRDTPSVTKNKDSNRESSL